MMWSEAPNMFFDAGQPKRLLYFLRFLSSRLWRRITAHSHQYWPARSVKHAEGDAPIAARGVNAMRCHSPIEKLGRADTSIGHFDYADDSLRHIYCCAQKPQAWRKEVTTDRAHREIGRYDSAAPWSPCAMLRLPARESRANFPRRRGYAAILPTPGPPRDHGAARARLSPPPAWRPLNAAAASLSARRNRQDVGSRIPARRSAALPPRRRL